MSLLVDEYRHSRDALHYGFAVGKVRVLLTRLLDRSALERLVDASSFAEQKRILSETPYGRFLEQASTAADVDEGLNRALDPVYAFVGEAGLPDWVQWFFRIPFDYTNLKAALRAGLLKVSAEDLLVDHGTVPRESFLGPLDKLPKPFGPLAQTVAQTAATTGGEAGLMAIDAAVDRALFADLHRIAGESNSHFLRDLATRLSDLANLKTVVRARNADVPAAHLAEMIVGGGSVSDRDLLALYTLSAADMLASLDSKLSLKGALQACEPGTANLDVIVDNAIVDTIRRARRAEPGPEDIIAYVRAREFEVQVLRVALLGKLAGLDSVTLHRRLRASLF